MLLIRQVAGKLESVPNDLGNRWYVLGRSPVYCKAHTETIKVEPRNLLAVSQLQLLHHRANLFPIYKYEIKRNQVFFLIVPITCCPYH